MKRFIQLFSAIAVVAMFALSCTEQDLAVIFGSNLDSKISAVVSGTHREYSSRYFASDSGTYQSNDHPQITIHDDSTFSFKLDRTLYNKDGEYVQVCFNLDKIAGTLELNKVYPLYMYDDPRALINLVDREDSGFVTTTYNALDGWVVFTKKKVHSGGFLFSGEFSFNGVTSEGVKAAVEDGIFTDCRICWGDDYGCSAY